MVYSLALVLNPIFLIAANSRVVAEFTSLFALRWRDDKFTPAHVIDKLPDPGNDLLPNLLPIMIRENRVAGLQAQIISRDLAIDTTVTSTGFCFQNVIAAPGDFVTREDQPLKR